MARATAASLGSLGWTAPARLNYSSSSTSTPRPLARSYSNAVLNSKHMYDLAACIREVEFVAVPHSTWPEQPKEALEAAAAAVPGLWILLQCGEWGPAHPAAGTPAHAILHTMVYRMPGVGEPNVVDAMQQYDLTGCYFHHSAFSLDSNGWPSGVLYPTLSYFEFLTTRRTSCKPSFTCKRVLSGRPNQTLGTWAKRVLKDRGATLAPKLHLPGLREWYRYTVEAAGIQLVQDDNPANF